VPKGTSGCSKVMSERAASNPRFKVDSPQFAPLWLPKGLEKFSPRCDRSLCVVGPTPPTDTASRKTTLRLHRLAAGLGGRLAALIQAEDVRDRRRGKEFAESCILSIAIWRRFGTADFAQSLGWLDRTDYAAMMALLPANAVEAAVRVWKSGRHAAGQDFEAQRCVRAAEVRAWRLGGGPEEDRVDAWDAAQEERARQRAKSTSAAGEAVVRDAYIRLLNAFHHPFWDLWRKRDLIIGVALGDGGLPALREALLTVRGFCGPDQDSDRAGWNLALDLKTMTPLSDSTGPVDWRGDYALWLRDRVQKNCEAPATEHSRFRPRPAQRRPLGIVGLDTTPF